MNYCEWVQGIIDDLESKLKEEVEVETLIQNSFYSKTHFYRIFDAMVGVSIVEYIKKRRLSCAVTEICMTKRRILDIALDYGYASQEVFTRACQREFHLSPGKLRNFKEGITLYPKINVKERVEERKDLLKDYHAEVIVNSGFHLCGYETVVKPGSNDIKQLWDKFMKHRDCITTLESDLVFGVCEFVPNITDDDEFHYFFGATQKEKVGAGKSRDDSFIQKEVRPSKYVKLYHEPQKRSLRDTYLIFYGVWLPIAGYNLEPQDTIEIYHLQQDCMEICIPIR